MTLPAAPFAGAQVELQICIPARGFGHSGHGFVRQKTAAEVGMNDHPAGVDHPAKARGSSSRGMVHKARQQHRQSKLALIPHQTLPDRLALEKRIAEIGLKFGLGKVPRPPHWSGFRVRPEAIEFWRDRPFRLHERLVFERVGEGWTTQRLYP